MHRPNGIATYNTYNARNQITELKNICEHCGWVLSSYAYTYDDRGFIIGEVAKEAQECDPYDRDNPYTPYRPEKLSKDCGHGKETSLTYRLVETARSFTYDDAGKLLSSTETVTAGSGENCGTSTWDYAYDLMGNRISEIRRDAKGTVVENNHYVYNDSNQMVQAKLCDGKKTSLSFAETVKVVENSIIITDITIKNLFGKATISWTDILRSCKIKLSCKGVITHD